MGIRCDKCASEFGTPNALEQHTQAKHAENVFSEKVLKRIEKKEERKAEKSSELKSERSRKVFKYGGIFLLLIIVGYGIVSFSSPTGNAVATSQIKIPANPIHWHPMLTIKINGQDQNIPPNIGMGSTIHQPIHTHEDELVNGARLLHMENNRPTLENMKLGFFFNVWGKKFNKDCIFDFCNIADKEVRMTVNGKENFDFENYFMSDGDNIVIQYG